MVESISTSFGGTFKQKFEDQLTCSVCLDQYTNPKTLPCHHSFCLGCIKRVPVIIKVRLIIVMLIYYGWSIMESSACFVLHTVFFKVHIRKFTLHF